MDIDTTNIINAISCEEELTRMLPLLNDIAIIEYDGKSIEGSLALAEYMNTNGIDISVVSRIILLGKKSSKTASNENTLSEIFPNARISVINKLWYKVNPRLLKVWNTLVFHMGMSISISDYVFDQESGIGDTFVDFVNKTRVAYYVCFLTSRQASFFDNPYTCRVNLRLREFALETGGEQKDKTNFCKEKQDYIKNCIKTLSEQDAFFQCIDETEHGCEDCNQCGNYGYRKQCPFAQRNVARYYKEGIFVPKDEKIAHQWEVMASRQDYKPANIQVADDLKDGVGCKKNIELALEIYSNYASQIGNEHCITQILKIAEEESEINKIVALPFIAQQAQDGNEDMIIKLSEAFQNAEYGLPKDMVQQKEWILQGAENGNPRFVLAMAKMYEENSDWSEAYNWYKNLENVAPELLEDNKLDEIELMMLTNGATPEEVTMKGMNYLYGFYGVERDLHLAYRCLKYASDKGIASAKGLLGIMYLDGLDVDEDFDTAIELLSNAAEKGDLLSMDKLTDLHYADDNDFNDGQRWENVIIETIEDEISKENPFAFYLKGHYQSLGYQYEDDDYAAFDNILKAAQLGIPKAQFEVSEMYSFATGTEYDEYETDLWLRKAAENGYYEAEGKYGIKLFEKSIFFNNTKRQSFSYLKNAYEKGYDEAYWCLAQCYMHGYGTNINKDKAYPLYQRAAEEGIINAQEYLCEKYFRGDGPLPKDYKLCVKWGEEAIKQGSKRIRFETAYSQSEIGSKDRAKELYTELAEENNAAAMNNLGCLENDNKYAAGWFLKAAEKGDSVAQKNIARYYRYGIVVEKNEEKALEYYIKSANQGYIDSIIELSHLYRDGILVEKDVEKSIEWYHKAIDKGDVNSMMELADIYFNGELIIQDMQQAIHYYKMAAERDNLTALYNLGKIYEYGTGVDQNRHKAIYWYRKAAKNGNYNAKESLKHLNSNWLDEDGNIGEILDEDFEIFD